MIEHPFMDQGEIAQIIAILRQQSWVKTVEYPGIQPGEISVSCEDGKQWRVARPIHLVRLKYRYQSVA